MNDEILKFLENELELDILENSNDNNLVIRSNITLGLLINELENEFISNNNLLLEIGCYFNNQILDYIKLKEFDYIIIIKL